MLSLDAEKSLDNSQPLLSNLKRDLVHWDHLCHVSLYPVLLQQALLGSSTSGWDAFLLNSFTLFKDTPISQLAARWSQQLPHVSVSHPCYIVFRHYDIARLDFCFQDVLCISCLVCFALDYSPKTLLLGFITYCGFLWTFLYAIFWWHLLCTLEFCPMYGILHENSATSMDLGLSCMYWGIVCEISCFVHFVLSGICC